MRRPVGVAIAPNSPPFVVCDDGSCFYLREHGDGTETWEEAPSIPESPMAEIIKKTDEMVDAIVRYDEELEFLPYPSDPKTKWFVTKFREVKSAVQGLRYLIAGELRRGR